MIETSLMVEDYPEPSEPKEKYYTCKCECICEAEIGIWAENQQQAEKFIERGDHDEFELLTHKVDYIISCECDD